MHRLPRRDRPVVGLMVRSCRYQAKEAEAADARLLLRTRALFAEILRRIDRLRGSPMPAT